MFIRLADRWPVPSEVRSGITGRLLNHVPPGAIPPHYVGTLSRSIGSCGGIGFAARSGGCRLASVFPEFRPKPVMFGFSLPSLMASLWNWPLRTCHLFPFGPPNRHPAPFRDPSIAFSGYCTAGQVVRAVPCGVRTGSARCTHGTRKHGTFAHPETFRNLSR